MACGRNCLARSCNFSGCSAGVHESRDAVNEHLSRRHRGVELAEHSDTAEPHPMDEDVRRGQVDFQTHIEVRVSGVVDARELRAHPFSVEVETLWCCRLAERCQICEQGLRVNVDALADESLIA